LKQVLIVGGGIVGLATAYRLQRRFPGTRVLVLEKEDLVCRHQTGNNSGVLHCGLYYKPGSAKARFAVNGIRRMIEFCREHGVAHEICGKLVVAVNQSQLERLRGLHSRGQQNGLEGLKWLSREEMLEIEPHVGGVAALRVPQEGIVDFPGVGAALVRLIQEAGGAVVTGARVFRLHERGGSWTAETTGGDFQGEALINCAGLHCDRVSQMAGERPATRIVPFRGEYYKIRSERQHLVRHLIYPVPDPAFPFLGVHFTRLIHGGIEAGPNAVLAFAREGYRHSDVNPRDLWDAVTFPGTWNFLRRHPRTSFMELRRSFSKKLFCQTLQRLVPEIREEDLVTGGAGFVPRR
jgi:L-2-hydroxyglutarate oxidase LhgO